MNFACKIKELRLEAHITQKELAKQLGCTQPMITLWEKGECEPTESVIRKTALFFNVSADYLLGLEDENGVKTYCNIYNNYGTH
ncbi:MAG: helix-turn-helix domain-containing protein [Roseburia sp.]|nr:helix-turn-helix domain-containing protein [Roseburia sp.]